MKLACISHSPLLLSVVPEEKRVGDEFFAAIDDMRRRIAAFSPELLVVFAPDHFNGFFYDVMPSFCVGFDATAAPDWGIAPGKLNVPEDLARGLVDAVRDDGFDMAVSRRMTVDHGFTIPLKLLTKRFDAFPVIPIFINCNAPPLPTCGRVRRLGEAIGRYLRGAGVRALVVGSGGLSHDPPHPGFEEAEPAVRELLVAARPWQPADELARQNRVKAAALALVKGGGPCQAPNRNWDRSVLDLLQNGDIDAVDHFSDEWITRQGGSGGHEIRAWIAAFAALGAGGRYRSEELYYEIVTAWITGMAVVWAES